MTVYVRWYGKILEGELLEGDHLGMKQVRIPLDGHHPVALFMPGHVYETEEQANTTVPNGTEVVPNCSQTIPKAEISDVLPADDRSMIETFKRENWDQEHNHLRIDKLDEFYQLWRMFMVPFGFVEAEAPVTLPPHKPELAPAEAVHESCTPLQQPQPNKPASPKPSKKMLRSTGQQQFSDSTQLALFD